MTGSVGLDIGGAHLKACLIRKGNVLNLIKVDLFKTPVWESRDTVVSVLNKIKTEWLLENDIQINVTMSAEMADCFTNRMDGVRKVLSIIRRVFGSTKLMIYSIKGLREPVIPLNKYKEIASANWHVTAVTLSKIKGTCILVDIGSTTTDIVPIKTGRVLSCSSSNDFLRLQRGELVYLGVSRTCLSSIRRQLFFRSNLTNVMRENFASTADLFRLTEKFNPKYDLYPTCDGKNKTLLATKRRLARIIGLDANDTFGDELYVLANQIKLAFIFDIVENLKRVKSRYEIKTNIPIVITGSGKFLARELEKQLECEIINLSDLFSDLVRIPKSKRDNVDCCATAFSLAMSAFL